MTDSLSAVVQRLMEDDYERDGDRGIDLGEFVAASQHPRPLDLITHWQDWFDHYPSAEEIAQRAVEPGSIAVGPPSREYLLSLINRLLVGEGTELEQDAWLMELEDSVPHPSISGLMAYPDEYFDHQPTAQEILDKALNYRAIAL